MKPTLKTYPDGRQEWFLNGKRHREDGPAIIWLDGTQEWRINGKLHREDGPAFIYPDGTQVWYLNDEIHREDGPAVIYQNGTQVWYLNSEIITQEVNNWAKERDIDLNNMSDADKMILKTELKIWR